MNTVASFFTLPTILAGAIVVSLNVYAIFGGADFGAGLWDLLATGPRRDQQRELIADAIAPIWEANHVWLILVVVLLFTAFPPAFALLMTVLHIPLTLLLLGIVLRGSAFTFRSYDSRRDAVQRRWGRIFAVASTATPFLLGVIVGAIASGTLPNVDRSGTASFGATYVQPWLAAFPLGVGALALLLFAFLAAVYLTLEAQDDALRDDFRRRALASGLALSTVAGIDLVLANAGAPRVWSGLTENPTADLVRSAAGLAMLGSFVALWRRRYHTARLAAVTAVSLALWGWAVGQYPYMVPPNLTIASGAAPSVTLRLLVIALLAGLVVLVPSLWYLFRVFKSRTVAKQP
jgi:cytochrome bd ubiquinol oxidase subunit II